MRNQMHQRGAKTMAWGLAILVLFLAAGATGGEGGGGEWDVCQRALLNCLASGFSGGILDQLGVFFRLEYCLAGFDFCRKYVLYYI